MRSIFRAFVVLIVVLTAVPAPAQRSGRLRYYAAPYALSIPAHRFHLTVREIAELNGIKDANNFNRAGLLLPDTRATRTLPLYVPWTPAPPRRACATTLWSFHDAPRAGCAAASCGSHGSDEACLCRNASGTISLDLTTSGHRFASLSLEQLSGFNPLGAVPFDVASVDIDGDGQSEILVSWLASVTCGLAEPFRNLVVFRDHQELVRYDSGEFSAADAAVVVGGHCRLASAHYEEAIHPLRGGALYMLERTFDPIAKRADAELVARRASDATRYLLPFDPGVPPTAPQEVARGTITRARRPNAWLESLSLTTSGGLRDIAVSEGEFDYSPLRVADAATRRVFPHGTSFPSMVGIRATFEARSNFYRSRRMLWLE